MFRSCRCFVIHTPNAAHHFHSSSNIWKRKVKMNAKLWLMFVVTAAVAVVTIDSELVTVKGRKYKPFVTPKYCITRTNPFKEEPQYSDAGVFNVYDELLKCNKANTCLGIVLGEWGNFVVGKTAVTPPKPSFETRGYLKIDGDTCPEGAVPYEPPEDLFSKNFCKHNNKLCNTERITAPIKVKNAESCLKKCIALPECTGVNYLENTKVTKRCELVQGHCRAGVEIQEMYGATLYTRLEHWRTEECPDPDVPRFCAEGDTEIVSETFKDTPRDPNTWSRDPTARCPDQHVITRCECAVGNFGSQCSGSRIDQAMDSCQALQKYKPTHIRARACCRPLKENMVPYYVTQSGRVLTCPDQTVAYCAPHNPLEELVPSEGLILTSASDPRTCTRPTSRRGSTDAVCLGTYKTDAVGPRECLEKETAADGESEATCEEGWYVSHCVCEGQQCAGTSTSSDARTCLAHGKRGAQVKARACCTKLRDREKAVIVSRPEAEDSTERAPYADCPQGGTLVTCLITSTSGSRVYVSGPRCWAPYSCLDCRVQVICTRELPPLVGPFKCAEGEREVIAGDEITTKLWVDSSSVKCKNNEYVTRCDCQDAEGKPCFNVGISNAAVRICSVYASPGKLKAQACCRPREKGQTYSVVSVPELFVEHWTSDKLEYSRGVRAPSAACPDGAEIVYCNLYKTPSNLFADDAPLVEGNRCFASGFCERCAIDLVCKQKKVKAKKPAPTKAPSLGLEELPDCGRFETEVLGEEAFGEWGLSEVTCPEGRYVSHCDAVKLQTTFYCGVSASKDGRTCRAMPGSSELQKVQARACCKKLKQNEEVYTVSDPARMYEWWRYPQRYIHAGYRRPAYIHAGYRRPDEWWRYPQRYIHAGYRRPVYIGCPDETDLVTCLVDTSLWGEPSVEERGNGCYSDGGYSGVGIMAICKGRKKWIEKLRG